MSVWKTPFGSMALAVSCHLLKNVGLHLTVALSDSLHFWQRFPASVQAEDILTPQGIVQVHERIIQAFRNGCGLGIGNALFCELVDNVIIGDVVPFGFDKVFWYIFSAENVLF